jgi:putative redox protein
MSEMKIRYLGAVQFEAESRGHKVFCDQPVEKGGFDEGMTPVEFLLAALGTCAGYYAAEYLKVNHLETEGLELSVNANKLRGPARLDNFQLRIQVPTKLDATHIEGLRHSVEKCLIHNTLLNKPSIETHVIAGEPDPVIE